MRKKNWKEIEFRIKRVILHQLSGTGLVAGVNRALGLELHQMRAEETQDRDRVPMVEEGVHV